MKKCINCNADLEDEVRFCSECGAKQPEQQVVVEETVEPQPEPVQWYYVVNSQTQGPVDETQMIEMIQNRQIQAGTYIWCAGMADWKMVQDTPMAAYLPVKAAEAYDPAFNAAPVTSGVIQPRSIILNLLLCFVTCGIWPYVWLYKQAKDINAVLTQNHILPLETPGMVVLYSLITCGLYNVYFYWKAGNRLSQVKVNNQPAVNGGTFLGLVALISPIISYACCQDVLNDIAHAQ